jgi:hypothetical protein
VTFDNFFFNNSFDLVRQWKNRSFLGIFSVHKKVKISISQTKFVSKFCLINVLFDFFPTWYWSNKTLIEHNLDTDLVRLILISTFNFFRLG